MTSPLGCYFGERLKEGEGRYLPETQQKRDGSTATGTEVLQTPANGRKTAQVRLGLNLANCAISGGYR